MSPTQVRMLSAGCAGVLGGGLLALAVMEPWCGPLGVLCLAWLGVMVWWEEDRGD